MLGSPPASLFASGASDPLFTKEGVVILQCKGNSLFNPSQKVLFGIRWIIQDVYCVVFKEIVGSNPVKNETIGDFVISSQIDL